MNTDPKKTGSQTRYLPMVLRVVARVLGLIALVLVTYLLWPVGEEQLPISPPPEPAPKSSTVPSPLSASPSVPETSSEASTGPD